MAGKKGGNWFYLVGGEVLGGVTNQSEVSAGAIPLRHGVNFELELMADRMLADARKGVTRHSEIKEQGYFSAMQLFNRRRKEYSVGLAPDPSIISGQSSRTYVPDADGGPRDLSDEYEYQQQLGQDPEEEEIVQLVPGQDDE